MAHAKEIRRKISSIKSTQKITSAMQMVAASKMRKAQDRMLVSMPYATKIRKVMSHVATSHSQFHHPYLQANEDVKRVGYIVVSTDRGLCGGLNVNLFRSLMHSEFLPWQQKKVAVDLCLIGSKAQSYFQHQAYNILAQTEHIGDVPAVADLIGVIRIMLDAFEQNKLQRLYIVHNEFLNTMVQRPRVEQLLPLEIEVEAKTTKRQYWDYIYEPDTKKLLDTLLTRYIETQVYQAVVDNIACEQAARMIAMKSATDNAGELISDLELMYNKARQAAITQEISEIISGAQAV